MVLGDKGKETVITSGFEILTENGETENIRTSAKVR